jgi:hypothetical protein
MRACQSHLSMRCRSVAKFVRYRSPETSTSDVLTLLLDAPLVSLFRVRFKLRFQSGQLCKR